MLLNRILYNKNLTLNETKKFALIPFTVTITLCDYRFTWYVFSFSSGLCVHVFVSINVVFLCSVNVYICMLGTVWTDTCVGQLCVGRTAAYIDVDKSRGRLGHSPKGYGVHPEPQLSGCISHDSSTPYSFSIPTLFSGACSNILRNR